MKHDMKLLKEFQLLDNVVFKNAQDKSLHDKSQESCKSFGGNTDSNLSPCEHFSASAN